MNVNINYNEAIYLQIIWQMPYYLRFVYKWRHGLSGLEVSNTLLSNKRTQRKNVELLKIY
jgi:hypothetical protein